MPIYEYRCKKCEQAFAIERSMSDSSPVTCSHCGDNNIARIWNVSFLSGSTKAGTKSDTAAQNTGTCASNPSQPKSCCPCS